MFHGSLGLLKKMSIVLTATMKSTGMSKIMFISLDPQHLQREKDI